MDNKLNHGQLYRTLTTMLWLAFPVSGLQYWSVWNQLPARIATHFAAQGQPNGWMLRQTFVLFAVILLIALLATFTWVLTRVRQPDSLAWSLLAMTYVVIGVLVSINAAVMNYNLYGTPVNLTPAILVIFVAAFAVMAVGLMAKRGPELPQRPETVEAEEVHSSFLWASAFAALTAIEMAVIAFIPLNGLRFALVLPAVLLLGVTALAWSGFHYRFTPQGVEIRTLGFRLRSIPLRNIKTYAVAPWNPLGGYGIRGMGDRRAYVWSNSGVRIMLSDGEVFLGHREPARIVNDLNLICQRHNARENARANLDDSLRVSSCA